MEKETQELIDKLNKNTNFPCKIAFGLLKENEDDVTIVSKVISNKSKIENIKYQHTRIASWTSEGGAVLSVKEYETAMEYLKELERLKNIWGFALSK